MIRFISTLAIVLAVCVSSSQAVVIRVPADQPTIQSAIIISNIGDTILVSPGHHAGATLSSPHFPTIVGTNPLDPTVVAATTIDWLDFQGSFSPQIVHRVSGVTLSGGGINIQGGVTGAYFQLSNNAFEYCPIGLDLSSAGQVRVDVTACTFSANGVGVATPVTTTGPTVYVRECSFEFNLTGLDGRFREVRGNRFEDNFDAAAQIASMRGDPFGLVFTRNHLSGTTGTALQCYVFGPGSAPAVVRVHNNYIVRNARGLEVPDFATIDSNTVALNDGLGLQIQGDPATVPIRNTILFGNGVDIDGLAPGFDITFSCLTQFYSGTGNIALDPQFADPAGLDFHLLPGSPCVNRGNPVYDWSIATVDSDNDQRVRGNRIDIGADETPAIGPSLLGDLNGDGLVNGLDIQTIVNMLIDG